VTSSVLPCSGKKRNFSNKLTKNTASSDLDPLWGTGFTDAEGSFSMSIEKSKTHAIGWTIAPCFIITLHKKDIELLKAGITNILP